MQLSDQRIGVLVPSSNVIVEPDAQRLLRHGVTAHFSRMQITRDDDAQLARLIQLAPSAAELLADAAVDAIAFACTTGSLHGGIGYDARIIDAIQDASGVPATTTATAVIAALKEAAARRIGLVTPYEPWLNEIVARFLEDNGIEVGDRFGFGIADPLETARIPATDIADAVDRLIRTGVDAVLISCTAFRGVEAAHLLADATNIPIVTSNGATYAQVQTLIDVDHTVR